MNVTPSTFNGRPYEPIMPVQQDSDELAYHRERVMLRHNRWGEPTLFVAKANVVTAGWVIGIMIE